MPFAPQDIVGAAEVWVADDIAQADASAVSAWAGRIAATSLSQTTGAKQPTYRTTGLASQPAVDFDGSDDILRNGAANAVSTASSGHVFAVVRLDGLATEVGWWGSADEAGSADYMTATANTDKAFYFTEVDGGTVRQVNGPTFANHIVVNTNYLLEVQSNGSAWGLRINGIDESLSVFGANNGRWFGQITNRDNFTVGGLKRSAESRYFDGKVATLVVVDGAIGGADRQSLYDWVTGKYGITLPAVGGGLSSLRDRSSTRGTSRGVAQGVA